MYDLGERDLLAEIEYKIILVMFSLVCFIEIVQIVDFFTLECAFIFKYFIFTLGAAPLYGGHHVFLQ